MWNYANSSISSTQCTSHLEMLKDHVQSLRSEPGFHSTARCTWCETAFALPSSCIHEMYLWTDSQEIGHRKTCAASTLRCLERIQTISGSVHHHSYHGKASSTSVSLRKHSVCLEGGGNRIKLMICMYEKTN